MTMRALRCAAAIAAALLLPHLAPPAAAGPPPLAILPGDLTDGLNSIFAPGSPGLVAVLEPGAAPVLLDAEGLPVIAAAESRQRRIVAFGHSSYATAEAFKREDDASLMARLIRWAGRGNGVVGVRDESLIEPLDKLGFLAVMLDGDFAPSEGITPTVLILSESRLSDRRREAVRRHLAAGGGLLVAQTGWGWQQLNNDAPMDQNHWNQVLADAGLAFTDQFAKKNMEGGFDAVAPNPLAHPLRALDRLTAPDNTLSRPDREQAAAAVLLAVRSTGPDHPFRGQVRELAKDSRVVTPSQSRPVRAGDALSRIVLAAQLEDLKTTPIAQRPAHPAAADFPGSVPADAERITRTVSITPASRGWISTGLYAAPGEPIRVTTARPEGLRLRIGCHKDLIWHLDTWRRAPEITLSIPLAEGETVVASPFGGLVYIEAEGDKAAAEVTITGAVAAPLFMLGQTTSEDWREIRNAPGPWAELASDKIIVSVPSSLVRELDDPAAVMRAWDEIADAAADLATIPRERDRPERYVADIQISAGYMHAGYPIMTHLDAAPAMVSEEKLRAGQWGLFHELGHNHQSPLWTFEGTGEVTVNLFSLYIMETVCGLGINSGHDALGNREKQIKSQFAKPIAERTWPGDPFMSLILYQQVREEFGWEPYKKVFAEYHAMPRDEQPRSQQDRRDMWLVRMSEATGRDLGPFFAAWGMQLTDAARAKTAHLPAWMPEGME